MTDSEKPVVEALFSRQLNAWRDDVDELKQRVDKLENHPLPGCLASFTMLKKVLLGNGDPEKSVAFRLAAVEKYQRTQSRVLWIIAVGVISLVGKAAAELLTRHS